MDALFERNYRAALEARLGAALEAVQSGDKGALGLLEDTLMTIQAHRFGIPKSSIKRLWSLNAQELRGA